MQKELERYIGEDVLGVDVSGTQSRRMTELEKLREEFDKLYPETANQEFLDNGNHLFSWEKGDNDPSLHIDREKVWGFISYTYNKAVDDCIKEIDKTDCKKTWSKKFKEYFIKQLTNLK